MLTVQPANNYLEILAALPSGKFSRPYRILEQITQREDGTFWGPSFRGLTDPNRQQVQYSPQKITDIYNKIRESYPAWEPQNPAIQNAVRNSGTPTETPTAAPTPAPVSVAPEEPAAAARGVTEAPAPAAPTTPVEAPPAPAAPTPAGTHEDPIPLEPAEPPTAEQPLHQQQGNLFPETGNITGNDTYDMTASPEQIQQGQQLIQSLEQGYHEVVNHVNRISRGLKETFDSWKDLYTNFAPIQQGFKNFRTELQNNPNLMGRILSNRGLADEANWMMDAALENRQSGDLRLFLRSANEAFKALNDLVQSSQGPTEGYTNTMPATANNRKLFVKTAGRYLNNDSFDEVVNKALKVANQNPMQQAQAYIQQLIQEKQRIDQELDQLSQWFQSVQANPQAMPQQSQQIAAPQQQGNFWGNVGKAVGQGAAVGGAAGTLGGLPGMAGGAAIGGLAGGVGSAGKQLWDKARSGIQDFNQWRQQRRAPQTQLAENGKIILTAESGSSQSFLQ